MDLSPKLLKYMDIAHAISKLSKDPSTRVGAVAIGPAWEIRAVGYNGQPRGADDNDPARLVRPEKYYWFEHAERNLIYNAARAGVPLEGCSLLVWPLYPCMNCARAIVQSGIGTVVTTGPTTDGRWMDSHQRAVQLFRECGITVHELSDEATKAIATNF